MVLWWEGGGKVEGRWREGSVSTRAHARGFATALIAGAAVVIVVLVAAVAMLAVAVAVAVAGPRRHAYLALRSSCLTSLRGTGMLTPPPMLDECGAGS